VSLYNEGADGPIYPTPVVGMVGILPDATRAGRQASELSKLRGEALPDGLPAVDIAAVAATLDAIRAAVRAGELSSAHDIAEGGLLVAVCESALTGGLGASLDLGDATDVWTTLFGERPGGFVVSGPRDALERLGEHAPVEILGSVGGDHVEIAVSSLGERWSLADLREANGALAPLFP
jgi:phosphoribosylformylglycinamidine (FGAM) synthase-like enzyme